MAGADFADAFEVHAIAAQVLDEAYGEHAGAFAGLVNAIEIVEDREPADFHAARFETLPRVEVRREFFVECDDDIAWLPCNARCHGRDAFGGVLHDGDLGVRGVDQTGGRAADAFVGLHPFRVVFAAIFESVLREALHGFGGGAAERRHGGVIQIHQPLGDRETDAGISATIPLRLAPIIHTAHQFDGRFDQQQKRQRCDEAERGDRSEKLRDRHRTIERCGLAGEPISDADREEPDPHHEAGGAVGREFGHGAQPDGTEAKLAERCRR